MKILPLIAVVAVVCGDSAAESWTMTAADEIAALNPKQERGDHWRATRGGHWCFTSGGEPWNFRRINEGFAGFFDKNRLYCSFIANVGAHEAEGPYPIGGRVAAGEILYHPCAAGNCPEKLCYAVDEAGTFDIRGSVRSLTNGRGNGIVARLIANAVTYVAVTTTPDGVAMDFDVKGLGLSAGQSVDLVLDGNGDIVFDATGVRYAISRVDGSSSKRPNVTVNKSEVFGTGTSRYVVPEDGWYSLEVDLWRKRKWGDVSSATVELLAAGHVFATKSVSYHYYHKDDERAMLGRSLHLAYAPRRMKEGETFEVKMEEDIDFVAHVRREPVVDSEAPVAIGNRLARIRFRKGELGGEIDRRTMAVATNNFVLSDVHGDWTTNFVCRHRKDEVKWKFVGAGMTLDAASRLVAYSGDEKLRNWTSRLRDELIASQDPDGYIGTYVPEPDHADKCHHWIFHDMEYIALGMFRNWEFCGSVAARDCAMRLKDWILENFPKDGERMPDVYGMGELMVRLYRATGDAAIREFAAERKTGCCQNILGALRDWDQDFRLGQRKHLFGLVSRTLAQLELFRIEGLDSELRATKHALHELYGEDVGAITAVGNCGYFEQFADNQLVAGPVGETCATAYIIRWLDSLVRLEGNLDYGDAMERSIYNALYAANSPDGRHICYFTPMSGRRGYYGQWGYCCPGNYRRIAAEVPEMVAYRDGEGGLVVNLFAPFEKRFELAGRKVALRCETDYPSDGKVKYTFLENADDFALTFRVPKWAEGASYAIVGGKRAPTLPDARRRQTVRRNWRKGDTLELDFPMTVRYAYGRRQQRDRICLMRGPVVFSAGRGLGDGIANDREFPLRDWTIDPLSAKVARDDEVRPGGVKLLVDAWKRPGGAKHKFVFHEFVDPEGRECYFRAPAFRQDELISLPEE